MSASEPHTGSGVPEGTMQAGSALYGHLRAPRARALAWPCPAGHGIAAWCTECLAVARAAGASVLADVTDAEARLAIDAGQASRVLHVGRLAIEALCAGLDVGLRGEHAWAMIGDAPDWAHLRGVKLVRYPGANVWQLSAGLMGMPLASGVVIQSGQ